MGILGRDKETTSLFLARTQKWKQFLKGRDPEIGIIPRGNQTPEAVFRVQ